MRPLKGMFSYRKYWMGFAMLWIIIFHADISSNKYLYFLEGTGYGGVDIFLFASGVGNYYSYLKDDSPIDFMKRRILRLVPVYLPFISLWLIVKIALDTSYTRFIFGNLFAIQGFTSNGGDFNWFLSCIIICYLLTPYFASFINRSKLKQIIPLFLFLLFATSVFWNDDRFTITVTRLPIYFIGMVFAKYENTPVTKRFVAYLLLSCSIGAIILLLSFLYFPALLWSYGLFWYPFIFIAPCLCIVISLVIEYIEGRNSLYFIFKPFLNVISAMGSASFEIFLFHIFAFELIRLAIDKYSLAHVEILTVATAFVSVVAAVFFHKQVENRKNTHHRNCKE